MLKSVRNALFSSAAHEQATRRFLLRGNDISWSFIKDAYQRDLKRQAQDKLRQMPKLKREVIELTSFSKMRVPFAKHVLCYDRLRAEIKTFMTVSGDQRPQATLDYLTHGDEIYGPFVRDGTVDSLDDVVFRQIRRGLDWFAAWERDARACALQMRLGKKAANRLFLAWQTWENLRIMIAGWIGATRAFIKWKPVYYVIPKHITQSPLESVFSKVRGMGGGGKNPTLSTYQRALGSLYITADNAFTVGAAKQVAGDGNVNLPELELVRANPKRKARRRELGQLSSHDQHLDAERARYERVLELMCTLADMFGKTQGNAIFNTIVNYVGTF